jgi:hypothetical protein
MRPIVLFTVFSCALAAVVDLDAVPDTDLTPLSNHVHANVVPLLEEPDNNQSDFEDLGFSSEGPGLALGGTEDPRVEALINPIVPVQTSPPPPHPPVVTAVPG